MTKVVGVRFKDTGKTYYFDPKGLEIKKGDLVVVETARGMECGVAQYAPKRWRRMRSLRPRRCCVLPPPETSKFWKKIKKREARLRGVPAKDRET